MILDSRGLVLTVHLICAKPENSPLQYSTVDPSIHLIRHKNNIQVLRNDVEHVMTHKLTPF